MSILNLLFVLSYGILVHPTESGQPDYTMNDLECNLEASVNIVEKENSYFVNVTVENSSGDLKYYFFSADTQVLLNTESSEANSIALSKKGQYLCFIKDDKDNKCHTKIEFVI